MSTAIYPGSFDPVTNGHIDIIKRAADIFDVVIVGVLNNKVKSPLFSVEERVNILKEVTKDISNVVITCYEGLLVDYCKQNNVKVVVRGIRGISDLDFELQLSQTNKKLAADIETVFLPTSTEYSYISSTAVREVASFGGDISQFVSPMVAKLTYDKYNVDCFEESRNE